MIIRFISLWRDVYRSYRGDSERHWLRLTTVLILSIFIAFASKSTAQSYSMMASIITVLAGFTFTALFSNHALATNDLPEPKDESDRNDLRLLRLLGENFRIRSSFFIITSVLNIVLILIMSIDLSILIINFYIENIMKFTGDNYYVIIIINIISIIIIVSFYFITSALYFLFFECLYTFYRLTETILSILSRRKAYLDSHVSF